MHVEIEALVSLHYEELPDARARRVRQHLAGCGLCRQEFERVRLSIEGVAPAEDATAEDSDPLLNRLRNWETARAKSGRDIEILKRTIATELAPYVGQQGADALLRPVHDDGHDLLSNVAPLLAMFLGRRAARILITRLVEKSIVGIPPLCES